MTVGVEFIVPAATPNSGLLLTNNEIGTIVVDGDGVRVIAESSAVIATGTFVIDNSGLIQSTTTGRGINFDLSVSPPGSITITNHATGVIAAAAGEAIFIAGDFADTITNEGTITGAVLTGGGADTFNLFTGSSISGLIDSGSGNDTINLNGSGQGTLQNFANVEVINVLGGAWTVNLQDGQQVLRLGTTVLADGQYDGTINNFASGDIIDLAGIGLATSATLDANNALTIAGGLAGPITLQLDPTQNFSGQVFQLTSDGAGGTNITLATPISNTGTINVNGIGIQITVSAIDPSASFTITNSGLIDATLDAIQVIANPANLIATGTFIVDNSGLIQSTATGRGINFDLSVSPPGSITITNHATGVIAAAAGEAIFIAGDSADTITNEGTITGAVLTGGGADTFNLFTGSSISSLIDSGSGNDTINLNGSGQGTLQNFANVEVINVLGGAWTVNLQDGQQVLRLGTTVLADGQYDGTINNFASGDIIDLAGIGLATSATLDANNALTIAGGLAGPITLQLDPTQNFSGQVFQLTSDGAGGTNITLATPISNTGTINVNGIGIQITVSAIDPSASFTITNSGLIEATLDAIQVIANPANLIATGTFIVDNSGTIESTVSGHAINFNLSVASPGSITIINQETGHLEAAVGDAIVIVGDSVDTITNKGTIIGGISTASGADTFNLFTGSSISGLIDSGSGNDTVNLYGNGQGTLQNFANVEVVNLYGGDWTLGSEIVDSVNFQDGQQVLRLGTSVLADGEFDGTINSFASGDIIDLAGIGLATSATLDASNVLTIDGGSVGPITLQLDPTQIFSGQVFQLTSDGAGGTNIALAAAATAGGAKADVLGGTSGNDVISSGAGNDIIVSGDGNDEVFGQKGDDTIQTGNGSSLLDGGQGNDVLIAGNGDGNILIGGDGKDALTVGDGNHNNLSGGDGTDTFHVGTGNSILSGGDGGDTFVFGPDSGDNVITDFTHHDTIQIDGVFADFQALLDASTEVSGDTVISLGADEGSITLTGASLDSLHAKDFLLT